MFLAECKYGVTEKKMPEYITDELEILSDHDDRKDSDCSDEENFNEEGTFQ